MTKWPGKAAVAMLTAALIGAAGVASGQGRLTVARADRPPRLDDFLGPRTPAGQASVTAFVQREPGDGVPASQATSAFLSYDDAHLYIVFVCRDDHPGGPRARLAPREAITADDQVVVLIDTFRDRRRAFLFAVNPLGIQADALVTEGQPDDYSFDMLWSSAGRITPEGFVASIAIPFKSLRLPPGDRQEWGIALARDIPRNSEQSYWPPITRRIEGLVPQFATLDGLGAIAPGRNAQLVPYSTMAQQPSAIRVAR